MVNLHKLTNGVFFRIINYLRKKLNVSIRNFCKQSHISTTSYYRMRYKILGLPVYLRLMDGFRSIATPQEFFEYQFRIVRFLVVPDADE